MTPPPTMLPAVTGKMIANTLPDTLCAAKHIQTARQTRMLHNMPLTKAWPGSSDVFARTIASAVPPMVA